MCVYINIYVQFANIYVHVYKYICAIFIYIIYMLYIRGTYWQTLHINDSANIFTMSWFHAIVIVRQSIANSV